MGKVDLVLYHVGVNALFGNFLTTRMGGQDFAYVSMEKSTLSIFAFFSLKTWAINTYVADRIRFFGSASEARSTSRVFSTANLQFKY